jgi:hypothetical protein
MADAGALYTHTDADILLAEKRMALVRSSKRSDAVVIKPRLIEICESNFKVAHRLYNSNVSDVEELAPRVFFRGFDLWHKKFCTFNPR